MKILNSKSEYNFLSTNEWQGLFQVPIPCNRVRQILIWFRKCTEAKKFLDYITCHLYAKKKTLYLESNYINEINQSQTISTPPMKKYHFIFEFS